MASKIDTTQPPDNVQADKAKLRQNFSQAATEITALQHKTRLAWQLATGVASLTGF